MIREEAIEIVKSAFSAWESEFRVPNDDWSEEHEALDMAIEALSSEAVQGVGRYENAIQKLRELPRYINGVKVRRIEKMPTKADTVEVVRCKDCKHNNNTCRNHGKMEPMCDFTRKKLKEMDFCSYGERNEE